MLSIVIPCYNEVETLAVSWPQLAKVSLQWDEPCEFVFVDDGSTDGTWQYIKRIAAEDERVLGLRLSGNLGQQLAIGIGLAHARGEGVVIMDADLQDPPELVPALLTQWRAGADMVIAVRRSRPGESWWKRLGARLVYRWLWWLGTGRTLPDAGDFALLDRGVVRWLLRWQTRRPFWRGLRELGPFRRAYVEYHRHERVAGQSHYSFGRLFRLAWDGLLGLTRWPVYAMVGTAAVCVLLSLAVLLGAMLGGMTMESAVLLMIASLVFLGSVHSVLSAQLGLRLLQAMELPPSAFVAEYAGEQRFAQGKVGRRAKRISQNKGRKVRAFGPPLRYDKGV